MSLWSHLDSRSRRKHELRRQRLALSPPIEPVRPDRFRNFLAFFLILAFVSMLPMLIYKDVPEGSKEIIVYIIGQLSGMATTCLAFYFTQKAGQDALDAKKAENTGKLADAVVAAANSTPTPAPSGAAAKAADEVADAAVAKADEFKAPDAAVPAVP